MSTLTGTVPLLRLALRRDRVFIPAWVVGIAFLVLVTASSFERLYPTVRERESLAASVGTNPAFRALYGPPFDLTTTGGLTAWRIGSGAALLAALMSLLLVVRHTRAEEETGRAELLGATVVGRHAHLAAALLAAGLADLAVALLVAGGLAGQGLPLAGSVAFGSALALTGCVFAGVAAVAAQVATTGRGAAGSAGALLALAFVLRAAGDVGHSALSWLSPIGWAHQLRPFAGERWWVLSLPPLTTVVLTAAAVVLVSRRDLGAGLVPPRPGPAEASPLLGSPLGLAWRLQRGVLLGWAAGFVALGAVVGAVAKDVDAFAKDSPQLTDVLRRLGGSTNLVDSYLASIVTLLGLLAAGYVTQAVLRIRAEETAGRAEVVLATAVSRWRWAGAHVAVAVVGSVVLMGSAGLALGVVHGLRTGDVGGQARRLLEASVAQVPAAWMFGAVAVLLVGLVPRLVGLAWTALALCFALVELGEVLELPGWVLDLSPFRHVPQLPAVDLTAGPVRVLAVLAAVVALAGLAGLRRRDIPS